MNKILKLAMENKMPVEMIYMSAGGVISQRIIDVNEISETTIKAFCHLRKRTRAFRIENILSVLPYKQQRKYVG